MRVLFLAHSFPRYRGDAAGAFILRLATALAGEGVSVRVLAPAAPTAPARDVIDGIPITRFRYAPRALETLAYEGSMATQVSASWNGKLGMLGLLGAELKATLDELRDQPAELIHAHWWFPGGLAAAPAAWWADVPLVTTLHGSDVRLGRAIAPARPIMRQVLRRSTRVTAVSSWLAQEAQAVAGGELPTVAPMPVAAELFSPDRTVPRGPSILFVGRLTKQKGVDVLLRAVALLPAPLMLDIVGAGEERASLEALAGALGIADRVRWRGARPASELASFYRRAAVLVMPSVEEGLGLVAVEAQLCGTPVIAFASGGVMDIVRNGETGVLVPERSAQALSAAITGVVSAPDRGARLASRAEREARERFHPVHVARRYADIYREAVNAVR